MAGFRYVLLHILSAWTAAEMTHFIWIWISKSMKSPLLCQLCLTFFCSCFFCFIVSLSLFPWKLLGVFLLNIPRVTEHAERIIILSKPFGLSGYRCDVGLLIYSTAKSAALTKCLMDLPCVCLCTSESILLWLGGIFLFLPDATLSFHYTVEASC